MGQSLEFAFCSSSSCENACKITGPDWSCKQYLTYMSGRSQLQNLAWVIALLQGDRNLNWFSWNTPTARISQLALHLCLGVKCFCCPSDSHGFLYILGLDGMELTFLIAAHKVLGFGSVAKTVLITHQCSSNCWKVLVQHQGFLFLTLLRTVHPPSK